MPLPNSGPINLSDFKDENFVSRALAAEASLFEALRSQALQAHEERCERIVRAVMMRVAEVAPPMLAK